MAKLKRKFLQIFVAFSENLNFNIKAGIQSELQKEPSKNNDFLR